MNIEFTDMNNSIYKLVRGMQPIRSKLRTACDPLYSVGWRLILSITPARYRYSISSKKLNQNLI